MTDSNKPTVIRRFDVMRIDNGSSEHILDTVAAEEPLGIRIAYWFKDVQLYESLAVTMRTPGHDRELAAGLLVSEGIVRNPDQLSELRSLGGKQSNEILAELCKEVDVESWKLARRDFVSSSCGVCGKRSREAIVQQAPKWEQTDFRIDPAFVGRLPALLAKQQSGFAETGGLHAAALVNASGHVVAAFEDVGRHNALDKVVGWSLLHKLLPLSGSVLFLSSRSSFELIQKADMAGCPILATVGGPSSLAIEAAREYGMTLIGFVRDGRFNVYSGDWRINS